MKRSSPSDLTSARRNIIAWNRDAQVRGWFDVADERHWPRKDQRARPASGDNANLTLESLNLRFEHNVYFAGPGQGWFVWGPAWRRHQEWSDLTAFQTDLRIDVGGSVAAPPFANLAARDYRLTREVMEQLKENYPQGAVADVLLGAQQ